MWAGKAAIQVRQAGSGRMSPRSSDMGPVIDGFVDDVDEHRTWVKAAGAKIVEQPHVGAVVNTQDLP